MRVTRTRMMLAAALCALAAVTTTAHSAPSTGCTQDLGATAISSVRLDVGTGETNGVPAAPTTVDARWDVAAPVAGNAYVVAPNAAWTTVADAGWINARPTNASNGVAATTFRTTFTLVPELVHRVLDLEYAADNGVTFYLNHHLVGGYDPPGTAPLPDQLHAFNQLHPLSYAGPFLQDGLNYLDAVVTDYGVSTGLLVRGAVSGCAVRGLVPTTCVSASPTGIVTYSPAPLDVGTSTAWHTGASGTGPVYAVPPWGTQWYAPTSATWISLTPTADSPSNQSVTTYSLAFTLPNDFSYGGVVLQFASDNDVVLRLNGVVIGGYAGGPTGPASFHEEHPISLASAPLHAGSNLLTADVVDYGVVTGLLVEGAVYACRGAGLPVGPPDVGHLVGGDPQGRPCAFTATTDRLAEAQTQTGEVDAGPLVTAEPGTLGCQVYVNGVAAPTGSAWAHSVAVGAGHLATLAATIAFRATIYDDVALCTTWSPDAGGVAWFDEATATWQRGPLDPGRCAPQVAVDLNPQACPPLLAVDRVAGTPLADVWQGCEPYAPLI
jgi:hypothetical protein